MNLTPILARLDDERRTLAYDSDTLETLPHITRLTFGTFHTIISSSLTGEIADEAIAAEIEHHRRLNVAFEWKCFSHDQPSDLLGRLERSGLSIGPREAVLVCPLDPLPAWIGSTDTSCVRPVTHAGQLAHYDAVQRAAFGEPNDNILASLGEALEKHSTQHTAFIAYDEDLPVAIGRVYTHPRSHFAGLYGGGTIPSRRHRGYYRALIAARAKAAVAQNARYLQVDALPTSEPILMGLGFQLLTHTWPCEWNP